MTRLGREPQADHIGADTRSVSQAAVAAEPSASRPGTFTDAYRQLDPYTRRLSRQFFGPGLDHDDIRQVALIGLWEAWKTHDPTRGHFRKFATHVMYREVQDAVTTARRMKRHSDTTLSLDRYIDHDTQLHEVTATRELGPEERVAEHQRLTLILGVVAGLTELERRVVLGRVAGESYASLGSAKSVDNALQRAKQKIRVALQEAA